MPSIKKTFRRFWGVREGRVVGDALRLATATLCVVTLAGCAWVSPATPPASGLSPAVTVTAQKPALVEPVVNAESRQLYQQALAALRAGRYAEAERGLLAVVQREPTLAGPHANLGILYSHNGKPDKAIESLRQAIQLNPDRAAYYNELGMVYRREGKFDEARHSYSKAVEVDATYANAQLNLGILYDLYLHDPEKALQHYERYRELAPGEAAMVTKWIADLQQRGHASESAKGEKKG